ncbi:TonB-dependent receptor [Litoribacillus peritrichatus]|uniref:TonB-dependent receptor n=1 Tax=Litoribacillus peritrichatus TaxID=718191 RepID=A0ABP7MN48_9GAMM
MAYVKTGFSIWLLIFCCISSVWAEEHVVGALEEEIRWLQEEVFVTTATKTKETIEKSGATVTVITAEDLRASGARTLMDALKRVPGLGVHQFFMGSASVEVRGVKTDFAEKVLFLVNGHPINNNLVNGGAMWGYNQFIVEDIKQVEIVRGPGSSLYGANAFVAVINVITKQVDDLRGVEVSVGAGSYDTRKVNIQGGVQQGDFDMAVNFNALDTDGDAGKVDSDAIGNSGRTDYWRERYEVGMNFSFGHFWGQGKYVERKSGPYLGANNVLNNESKQKYVDYFIEGGYRRDLTSKLGFSGKVYFNHFEFDNFWEIYPEGSTVVNADGSTTQYPQGLRVRSPINHDVTGIELQLEYQLSLNQKLLFGTLFEHQSQYGVEHWLSADGGPLIDISENANWNDSHVRDITAAFIQDIWDITEDIRLIAGARYDYYSDFGDTFNPRASLTWAFHPDVRFITTYGSAFRAPTFGELYNINNPAIVGNPNVNPEEIETFEIGFQGNLNRKTSASFIWFYNQIDELIASVEGDSAANTHGNAGKLSVQGAELEIETRLKDGSTLAANYTYQHAINEVTDERTADVPLHRANLTFNYYISRNLSFFSGLMYKGETYRVSSDARDNVDEYVTLDLALVTQGYVAENLDLKLTAYNVFDKQYFDPTPIGVMESDYPKPGRSFFVDALYHF